MGVRSSKVKQNELYDALLERDIEAISTLLADGVNPNFILKNTLHPIEDGGLDEHDGMTPLIFTIHTHHVNMTRLLLENGAKVDYASSVMYERSTNINLPIHKAVEENQTHILEMLINHGADVNSQTRIRLYTPLHVICRQHHERYNRKQQHDVKWTVHGLLANGADVNLEDKFGSIPLHYAVQKQKTELIETLLDAGSDITHENLLGMTPIMNLLRYKPEGTYYTLQKLINRDPSSVRRVSKSGETLLSALLLNPSHHHPCRHTFTYDMYENSEKDGPYRCLEYLLDSGADANEVYEIGLTPLWMAILENNQPNMIKCLVVHHANIDYTFNKLCSNAGIMLTMTPLMYCLDTSDFATAKFLIESGADTSYFWQCNVLTNQLRRHFNAYLMQKYLDEEAAMIKSLQLLCRAKIRRCFGKNLKNVFKLQFPKRLQTYIFNNFSIPIKHNKESGSMFENNHL